MQTFLPYASFEESAKCLDYRRLGKQRVEARQILNALLFGVSHWKNHPATKMWKKYEEALKEYSNVMIKEWVKRGYNNTMKIVEVVSPFEYPKWFGDERFHASHRSNLLRKNFEYYSKFGWKEDTTLEYMWPTKESKSP